MDFTLAGPSGELRASYVVTVELADWRLSTVGPSLYRLTGRVTRTVPALLSLLPMQARLRLAKGPTWEWVVEAVACSGDQLEASLTGDPIPTGG